MRPEDRLARRLRAMVESEIGLDPFADHQAKARIVEAARRASESIARDGHAAVTLPALLTTGDGPYHLAVTLFTRDVEEGER